ncbi:hypothetical protein AYK26_00715 [Euryarchaeota archaeon SM23-78]|nr:MAG: hypothetical protein AYK26_00715 [Euryarchaeota archaeon SM23-78]
MKELFEITYHWFLVALYLVTIAIVFLWAKRLRKFEEIKKGGVVRFFIDAGYNLTILSFLYTFFTSISELVFKNYSNFWTYFTIGCGMLGLGVLLLGFASLKIKKYLGDSPYRAEMSLKELEKRNKAELKKLGLK